MADFIEKVKAHLPSRRRLIQLYAALLYNAHIKGYITGNIFTGASKIVCVPGFNCYSCPGAVGACPLGALQNALAASGSRTPTYVLGILMLYGITLGRTICGYLCPLGLLQELLHKLPTPKIKKSRVTRVLSWLKYVFLAVLVVAVPLWYAQQYLPVPGFCKYICPAGTFEGAIGLLSNPANADKFSMLGILFTRKFAILALISALCIFFYRAFCRFICPLGAIYGLFARVNIIGVKVEKSKCVDCGKCVRNCGMDIRHVGDHECIHCGECIDLCPTKAISFKAGSITLRKHEAELDSADRKKNKRMSILAWSAALMLLAGVIYYVNFYEPAPAAPAAAPVQTEVTEKAEEAPEAAADTTEEQAEITGEALSETEAEEAASEETEAAAVEAKPDESIPEGKEIGMRAPNFTVPLFGGESFTLSEHLGKPVVVNFWATWCTPCCAELPHFSAIYEEYSDSVSIVAIHSMLVTDNVENYLANYNYSMPFGLDESGSVISSFGGSTMLPHTVIIDENGIITYNSVGSLTYEKLEALLNLN